MRHASALQALEQSRVWPKVTAALSRDGTRPPRRLRPDHAASDEGFVGNLDKLKHMRSQVLLDVTMWKSARHRAAAANVHRTRDRISPFPCCGIVVSLRSAQRIPNLCQAKVQHARDQLRDREAENASIEEQLKMRALLPASRARAPDLLSHFLHDASA